MANPTTGETSWGTEASGNGKFDVTIDNSFDDGNETKQYHHVGHTEGTSEFEEEWSQDIGSAVTGGILVDTGSGSWNYTDVTTYLSPQGTVTSTQTITDSAGPGTGGTNTLYELEFETGWDPEDLFQLEDDLSFSTLAGAVSGSGSAGPSGEEGTIPYTPPPGSEPEEPVEEEPPPSYEPVPYGWAGYWYGVGQVFKGYGNAAVGVVEGLAQITLHPLQTAEGLIHAAAHPIDTGTAIINDYADKLETLEGQGEIVGEILITVASSGTTAAATKAAQAGKFGRRLQRIAKAVPGGVSDVNSASMRRYTIPNRIVQDEVNDYIVRTGKEFAELGGDVIDLDVLGPERIIDGRRVRVAATTNLRKKTITFYKNARVQDVVEELAHFKQAVRDGVWGRSASNALVEIWEGQIDTLFKNLGMVPE